MPPKIPDEKLLADLRRVADDLGKSPTISEYDANGAYSSSTHRDHFGTWTGTLDAAGLEIDPCNRNKGTGPIPEEELILELEVAEKALGRVPRARDMDLWGAYSTSTYCRRFGSWSAALDAAGIEVDR